MTSGYTILLLFQEQFYSSCQDLVHFDYITSDQWRIHGGGRGTMALPKLVKNFVCTNFLHTSSVSKCSCITAVTCNAASVYCSLQSLRECCVRTYSTAHFPTTYMQSRCSRMFSISPALFVPCPATIAHVVPRIFLQRRWNPIDGVSAMHCGSNCPLARAMDGHIMRCDTTGSCQSAATSEIVKRCWSVTSMTHVAAL